MRWLIDGYNVIRRDPGLRAAEAEGLEAGRRALLARVAEVARRSDDHFTVVFDGAPIRGGAPAGRLEVIFSRPPDKADDVLVRLARQAGDGAVVVTSDRTVQDAARRAGAIALGAEQFLDALASSRADELFEDKADEEEDEPAAKRGNPRRLSKEARGAQRAVARLRRALRGIS